MKGVFIRGMKMPKSCLYCEFRKKIDQDNFRCKILGYPIEWRPCYIQERDTNCPLIEVEIDTDNNVGTTDVPDINVGDMISRQAAIDALRTCYDTETITMDKGDEYINYGDAVGEIEQLPPIQPIQPKRGKWIRTGSGSLYDHYECSECGKTPKWNCMGNNYWQIAFTDYCPNCGADMRGEKDG